MDTEIGLRLNAQQLDLLDRSIAAGEAVDHVSLTKRAIRETAAGALSALPIPGLTVQSSHLADTVNAPPQRIVCEDFVLEPGTGKAIERAAGTQPA